MQLRSYWIAVAALASALVISDGTSAVRAGGGPTSTEMQRLGVSASFLTTATETDKAETEKSADTPVMPGDSTPGQPQKNETTGTESSDEVQALKTRIIELQNDGKLGFRKIVVCRSVEGFGAYSPLDPGEQVPKIILYCEPSNVSTMVSADRYIVDCSVDAFLMDSGNKLVLGRQNVVKINRVSRSPIIDLFFKIEINAQKLGNRNVILKVVLHDKIKNQSVSTFHKINLEGGAKKTLDRI